MAAESDIRRLKARERFPIFHEHHIVGVAVRTQDGRLCPFYYSTSEDEIIKFILGFIQLTDKRGVTTLYT